MALPLHPVGGLSVTDGDDDLYPQLLQNWPFSSSDLYNWKNNKSAFSDDPAKLTGLVESLMFSHQPTWDDCQQLLVTLFTTEERKRLYWRPGKMCCGQMGGHPSTLM